MQHDIILGLLATVGALLGFLFVVFSICNVSCEQWRVPHGSRANVTADTLISKSETHPQANPPQAMTLYYLAEIVEDYGRLGRNAVRGTILGILAVHALLWLVDDVALPHVAMGAICHAWHLRVARQFPQIPASDRGFLGSCVLSLVNHFQWFYYFTSRPPTTGQVASFFVLMVWLTPLLFFVSLTSSSEALPWQRSPKGRVTQPVSTSALPDLGSGTLTARGSGGSWTNPPSSGIFTSAPPDEIPSPVTAKPAERRSVIRQAVDSLYDLASWRASEALGVSGKHA